MKTYQVKLFITTENDPNKWNWHEIVGLEGEEQMFVEVEEVVNV